MNQLPADTVGLINNWCASLHLTREDARKAVSFVTGNKELHLILQALDFKDKKDEIIAHYATIKIDR